MYAQNKKWNPSNSNSNRGEALSRVLGGLLYPGGQQPSFTVHQWVDNLPDGLNPTKDQPVGATGLEDWVGTVNNDDTRAKSIGCGVAFMHYLHYQLGFSFEAIAGVSADTLEEVYHSLTGSTGGFQPFAQLVRHRFPVGSPSGLNGDRKLPNSDQFFPLLGDGRFQIAGPVSVIHPRSDEGAVSLYVVGLDGKVWSNFWPSADSGQWAGWFPVGDNTFPIYVPVSR